MTTNTNQPSREKDIAEQFSRDTAQHVMTVLRDDGLYRHIRFQQPDRSGYWFELVTWPGSLAIRGDLAAGYVFSRLPDMFQFFRRNANDYRINPHYWSEKLPDYGRSVREYSEDVLRAELESRLAEYEIDEYADLAAAYEEKKAAYDALPPLQRWPYGMDQEPVKPLSPAKIRKLIAEYDGDGDLNHEGGARELLRELEQSRFVSDTWEWSLADWSREFLWSCHAIVWGIAQYDAAKQGEQPPAASPVATAANNSGGHTIETVELAGVSR